MVLRNVGVPFSFDDHTSPVSGDEGESIKQSDSKLVTRSGAAKEVADIDVDKNIAADGDYETDIIDIGGTSGIAIALDSAQGNTFEVQIGLYDDNNNLRSTLDSTDYPDLEAVNIIEVVPVFSDLVKITITDTSGATDNDVSGSINANIGTPSQISATISSGRVQIAGADDNTFEDEQLNAPVADSAVSQVSYLARALNSKSLDEFVTRVTNSGGVQIDPLTTDVTQTASNDEVRTRLYGVDTSNTLVDVDLAELGNGVGSTSVSQLTYLARALGSQSLDEMRVDTSPSEPLDVSGAEVDIDIATQTLAQLVADLELEDAGGTGTYGGVRRRSNAIQTSLENDQVGLLQTADQPFDVSGATVTVTDDGSFTIAGQPLDVSASTVPVEQQTPVAVEDSGGTNIDPLARQDTSPVTGSTTTDGDNVGLVLGDYRKGVDWFVDTSGAATLTVEVRTAGGTWRQFDTVDYADATTTVEQYSTSFAEMRARVDTALNTLEGSSKGV